MMTKILLTIVKVPFLVLAFLCKYGWWLVCAMFRGAYALFVSLPAGVVNGFYKLAIASGVLVSLVLAGLYFGHGETLVRVASTAQSGGKALVQLVSPAGGSQQNVIVRAAEVVKEVVMPKPQPGFFGRVFGWLGTQCEYILHASFRKLGDAIFNPIVVIPVVCYIIYKYKYAIV